MAIKMTRTFHSQLSSLIRHAPGAKANMATDSPEEAMEVTRARRREKYWARMVTVGRKVRE